MTPAERMRRFREKRRAAMLCTDCGTPSDWARCPRCVDKKAAKRRIAFRVGQCVRCGKAPRTPGRAQCRGCIAYYAQRYRAQLAAAARKGTP